MIAAPKLEFAPILPELFLCGVAILGLLYEAIAPKAERLWHLALAFAGLIAAALATFPLWHWDGPPTVMRGMVSVDRFSVVSRLLLLGIAGMGLLLGTHYFARSGDAYRGEFYPLILFATAGMTLITAAADLILVFLALEILSLSLYVLTGITGRRNSNEAAMKYFLLGAFSSAFFLFGVAWAYGATGTTSITAIANALAGQTGNQALALLAFVFLAIGFGFKVSAVPFHQWTPDVYQGAPTPVTAFMSAATKVAAFLALIRVLDVAFQPLTWDWTPVIWVLAAASVIVGSVLAIAQSDIKRMLAYSSIAHAGFILTGPDRRRTRSGSARRCSTWSSYALMTLGAFGVVMLVSARGEEQTSLSAYAGLSKRSPLLAGLMTLFLLSLAGIPPTVGFVAKVGVFTAAIRAGHTPLALIGVLVERRGGVLLPPRDRPDVHAGTVRGASRRDRSLMPRVAIAIPAILTLALGIFPGLIARDPREGLDPQVVIR